MSDKHSNGLQWENLALKLIDLSDAVSEVAGWLPGSWRPAPPSAATPTANLDAWQKTEAEYRGRVHEAVRAVIGSACVPDLTPEILYFLSLRLRAALNHIETMCIIKDEKPLSLFAFPALPSDEVIEWLLTEWADDHAIMIVFPTPDVPCAQSAPAPSFLAPSF